MPDTPLLLCSDLDRTLIPNGPQPESPEARPRLRAFAARPDTLIAYVSGRHRALIQQAIEEWALPIPDFAIGDVGTTIYRIQENEWVPWTAWEEEIAPDWAGHSGGDLANRLADLPGLRLQEEEKQNRFKLSYYLPLDTDHRPLLDEVARRLDALGVRANLIWSIDEAENVGLLDLLPASADKLHAIRFLIRRLGLPEERTLFSGDSGNDLAALTSGLPAILVRNAADEVRDEALRAAPDRSRLYLAHGGFDGMNGYYAAGVLEGIAHFHPEFAGESELTPRSAAVLSGDIR
ncbi:hypothetical protein JCM17961_03130 [Endothiovibrio diazotrophicus]